jgi:hypothetical protein
MVCRFQTGQSYQPTLSSQLTCVYTRPPVQQWHQVTKLYILKADTLTCRQFGCHVVYVNHELKGTTVAVDKLEAGLAGY